MEKKSKFSYKYVDMLIAARTVVQNFEDHKAELVAMRSTWEDPYIGDLKIRINYAISHYLGQNPKKDLKLATLSINELQETTLNNLSLLKVQLDVDFGSDKLRLGWLLDTLGYSANYAAARKGNQEAMIELLYTFKENMVVSLKDEFVAKGIRTQLIDSIISAADTLREADVEQENLKDISRGMTDEALEEFNWIYTEIMSVCRICAKLFKDKPTLKKKFIFSRIVKRLNHTKSIKKPYIRRGIEGIENQINEPNLRDDLNPDSPPNNLDS